VKSPLRRLDKLAWTRFVILTAAVALTVVGIAFVHSTTVVHSTTGHDGPFPSLTARKQIRWAIVALGVFVVLAWIDYRLLDRLAYGLYGVMCLILTSMIVLGDGSFIEIGKSQVQPSEPMKIVLIITLARYLRYREDQRRLRGLVGPFVLTVVPMVLVQPDLGTSLMFPPVLLGMLFVSGARPRHLVFAVLVGASLLPAAYYLGLFRGFQQDRITDFVRQGNESPGERHLLQSKIAIGSGGLEGKGYGQGTQNTLRHLPEKHTDFIYSIVAEEWGFLGASGVALLFAIFVTGIVRVAIFTREPFGRLAVTGVAVVFAAQSVENMGMTMGLLPITGVPLPFVSQGGTSLVASYGALAIAFNVAVRRVRVVATRDLAPRDPGEPPTMIEHRAAGLLENRWSVE
jgi:rod shape determining protein RodA